MLVIQRPSVEAIDDEGGNRQRFAISPLEPGFGHTIGNSLRRTLLSSIPGAAITQVRFDDALHEFDTIAGVTEDVTDVILNLKDVVLVSHSDEAVTLAPYTVHDRAAVDSHGRDHAQWLRLLGVMRCVCSSDQQLARHAPDARTRRAVHASLDEDYVLAVLHRRSIRGEPGGARSNDRDVDRSCPCVAHRARIYGGRADCPKSKIQSK